MTLPATPISISRIVTRDDAGLDFLLVSRAPSVCTSTIR